MIRMKLSFVTIQDTVALNQTTFSHPLLAQRLVSVRGAMAPQNTGTFRWSSGVRALTLLLTKQALLLEARKYGVPDSPPVAIHGYQNSLAASLDYAISKQPLWLQDMFGMTPQGLPIVKLLLKRMNPDRKRPGPVTVFIQNLDFSVEIELDGAALQGERLLRHLESCLVQCSSGEKYVVPVGSSR